MYVQAFHKKTIKAKAAVLGIDLYSGNQVTAQASKTWDLKKDFVFCLFVTSSTLTLVSYWNCLGVNCIVRIYPSVFSKDILLKSDTEKVKKKEEIHKKNHSSFLFLS